ncbi:GlxA family transcriptional regulator [Streptomyces sp. NPDC005775]|uniref:GlxA family transcriptional regulator n=1 Tax=unclassified Streptomyces TaxID=2593676 RepID=UPI0033C882BC
MDHDEVLERARPAIFRAVRDMTSVRVLDLEGAMATSVAITVDVLDTANRLALRSGRADQFDVQPWVANGYGDATDPVDLVVVPGLGMRNTQEVRSRLAAPDARAGAHYLKEAAAAGSEIAASCAGVFLLAEAGILDQRRATTTWWLAPLFACRYPAVRLTPADLVVTDGPVTTAGAALAHLDLMLTLVGRHGGEALARECARYLAVDRRRSQSPYVMPETIEGADSDVAIARSWALQHLDTSIGVRDLAAAAHLSPRTFTRRISEATGMSPARFLRRLRVERAVELLHNTDLAVTGVAHAVGYSDPTALRRAMSQELGMSPRTVRGQRTRAH